MLKLGWTDIAQAGVKALTVVPELNELEDMAACLVTSGEAMPGALPFECPKEALDHGVVIAACLAADRLPTPLMLTRALILAR